MSYEFSYRVTKQHAQSAIRVLARPSVSLFRWAFPGMALAAAILWFGRPTLFSIDLFSFTLGWGAMAACFTFSLLGQLRNAIENLPPSWLEAVEAVEPISLRVDENGVSSVIDGRRMRRAWLDLLKVTVHDDMVLLWTMNSSGYVVPRSVFTDDQSVDKFVAFSSRHIGQSRFESMKNQPAPGSS